jgi:hypothetical protein
MSGQTHPRKKHEQNKRWQNIAGILAVCAEIANVGIFVEVIAKWIPRFAALAASPALIYLMAIADPLIYCFRAAIRLTRLAGRHFFGIKFEEETHDTPVFKKVRTVGDVVSLSLFILAILTFAGFILSGPVGLTLAWALSLSGLMPIAYFDYIRPAHKLEEELNYYTKQYKDKPKISQEVTDRLIENYTNKNNSKRLYIILLVGLSLLLICGTAAAFAPPLLAPILFYTSKTASLLLGAIACSRFVNFVLVPGCYLHIVDKEAGELNYAKYKKNYLFLPHKSELLYVTDRDVPEVVPIDAKKFNLRLQEIKKDRWLLSKLYTWLFAPKNSIALSEKEREKLLPLVLPPKTKHNLPIFDRPQVVPLSAPEATTPTNKRPPSPSSAGFYSGSRPANNRDDSSDKPAVGLHRRHSR